jgi:RimJ/RimL family protein N-acetyltransferase
VTPPCEFLPWDTAFFGFRVGRISGDRLPERDVGPVMDWVREERIRCLYFLCTTDHDESVRVAERLGFHLVDVRMDFLRKVPADAAEDGGVRLCEPGDEAGIIAIAAESYRHTRFYFDPNFTEERASALYREWARKSCEGWADAVWVAPARDGVGGFATCHVDTTSRGRIGLVGVRAGLRGAGIGPLVVGAALSFFARRGVGEALVTTQARNLEAQRLYQKCGFRTHKVAYWYHRWFAGEEGR